jgi:hypothetical protein
MPFRTVILTIRMIAQRRINTSLSGTGMRTDRVNFRDQSDISPCIMCGYRRPHSSQTAAYNQNIVKHQTPPLIA